MDHSSSSPYPTPSPGASLLLAFRFHAQTLLIIGSNALAAARAFAALEASAKVIVLASGGLFAACDELKHRIDIGQVEFQDLDSLLSQHDHSVPAVLDALLLRSLDISLACVTDTLIGDRPHSQAVSSLQAIYDVCRRRRVPINVTDIPEFCTYTFPTTHRVIDSRSMLPSPLQISVTTNGEGCRLATRIRRDITSRIHKDAGVAVSTIGKLRRLAKAMSPTVPPHPSNAAFYEATASASPNTPVPQSSSQETPIEAVKRRMKWIAQVSEFWPFEQLARMSENDMHDLLNNQSSQYIVTDKSDGLLHQLEPQHSRHSLASDRFLSSGIGRIYLVGAGVGHPSLLTIAAHDLLVRKASLVLSDKLVPETILRIIPEQVKVVIARKFPGNNDNAQQELMRLAIDAAATGQVVVRLKQGDPMIYGRAGEEILYFRERGFEPTIVPGISSVIAGPTFANIPITQRGVAESFVVCTGVGRHGKDLELPGYQRERTTIILMGVARLGALMEVLMAEESTRRQGAPYPAHLPIAIIERASMPDQRIVTSTIGSISAVIAGLSEQRPPGMMVIGWSVMTLSAIDNCGSILDEETSSFDVSRVQAWLGSACCRIIEGPGHVWLTR